MSTYLSDYDYFLPEELIGQNLENLEIQQNLC